MKTILAFAFLCFVTGCSALSLGENLPRALANHPDPETVGAALPAYMVAVDGLIVGDEEDAETLRAGAKLYTTYGALFVNDPERLRAVSGRAYAYAAKALEEEVEEASGLPTKNLETIEALLPRFTQDELPTLHTYCVAWLLWIKARADDWNEVAQLPKVERLLERIVEIDDAYDAGSAHLYLGILRTLRPPALGGDPESGRVQFERALAIGGNRNLAAKVEYARSYARMMYDRKLHDRLLGEVLEAPAEVEGFTLTNTLAKRQARELQNSADEYFDVQGE
jgi:hypothetical protein